MPRRAASAPKAVELDRRRAPRALAIFLFVGIAATVGAIVWGQSDAGQINVAATINSSAESEGGENVGSAATAVHTSMPNGGLVPQGGDTVPAPTPLPVVVEDASTTPTTTPESVEDDAEGEAVESEEIPAAE